MRKGAPAMIAVSIVVGHAQLRGWATLHHPFGEITRIEWPCRSATIPRKLKLNPGSSSGHDERLARTGSGLSDAC
jgi:hypothetical protein